jgi:prophage antirepressor-like protein
MSDILPFDFEGVPVRVIEEADGLCFVSADVCRVLGISYHRDAMKRIEPDEGRRLLVDTPGGSQKMACVTEPGLYRLIFKSRKEQAKRFQKWVFSDVLPAIRKTGKYEVDSEVEEIEEDVAPRMTIPQFLKTKPTLTFDGICALGALIRRSNQALGCSYQKECHPRLGRIRSYPVDVLEFAWSRFLRQNSEVRYPQLPGLEGLDVVDSAA